MEPVDVAYDICRYYVEDLENEVDHDVWQRVNGYRRARDHAQLASCSRHFDRQQHSVKEWRFLRQVEAFFKKNANLSNKNVCKEAAQQSFVDCELNCSLTNRRLKPLIGYPYLMDEGRRREVKAMEHYISGVLGDVTPFLDELPRLVKVTPGATASASRRNSLPQRKMTLRPYCTKGAEKYLRPIYSLYGFDQVRFRRTSTNRIELVPKNWKTDRTIACEPEGNLPLQLAFDRYAKRRLRRYGIDLSNQSANQKAARHASIHNDLVTVDFANASSSICYNAVSLVFPVDWLAYLLDVRSPSFRGVFGNGDYAMFSSMGNGSTFTVETLIFAAACHAVGAKGFLVYGDDVIIDKEHYDAFLSLAQFLGFTVNVEKTFADGPFRESCGGDFYNGVDVTPVYIRNIDGRKANLCHLVNTIGRIALHGGKLESYLISLVKTERLPLVPFNESTMSGVWIDPTMARRRGILRNKDHMDTFKAYEACSAKKCFVDSRGYYLWFLRKNSQVLFSAPWELSNGPDSDTETVTSSARIFDHKYVRRCVSWREPAHGLPDHLYWWSEQLLRV